MDLWCDGSTWQDSQSDPNDADSKAAELPDTHLARLHATIQAEVHSEVSKQVEEVRRELHRELAELDAARVNQNMTRRVGTSKSLTSIVKSPTTGEVHAELELEGNIWDAALFIGFPQVGSAGSLLIVFALLLNIFIQIVFILIIATSLVKEQFTSTDLEGLAAWRYKVGHDNRFVSGGSGTSLVERVCRQDLTLEMATEQKNMLATIEDYLPGSPEGLTGYLSGPVMCVLALCVWTMCVLQEVSNIWDRLGALWMLPTAGERSELAVAGDNSLELRSLSWGRAAVAVVIAVLRLAIALTLLWIGLLYLCYTVSIGDLLLNAMALEMVMHMDELVFYVMAPASLKELIGCLEPLRMRPWPRWRGVDANGLATPALLLCVVLFFYKTELTRSIDNLNRAREILCDGTRNFSFSYDGLEMVRISRHPPFDEESAYSIANSASGLATKEVLLDTPVSEWRYALLSESSGGGDGSSTSSTVFMSQSAVARLINTIDDIYATRGGWCHDALDQGLNPFFNNSSADSQTRLENQWRVWRGYLARELGLQTVTSCSQIRSFCFYERGISHLRMALMRSLCPVTCGCNSLSGGTVVVSPQFGCPGVCLTPPLSQAERDAVNCTDLETTPGDPRYEVALGIFNELALGRSEYNITRQVGLYGCGIITLDETSELCAREESNLLGVIGPGDPYQFQVVKRMTMLCPVTCNCGGVSSATRQVPPEGICPSDCSCFWRMEPPTPIPRDVPTSCTVPNWIPGYPVLGTVATDSRCCHLLVNWAELHREVALGLPENISQSEAPPAMQDIYDSSSQAFKSKVQLVLGHFCKTCWETCAQLWVNLSFGFPRFPCPPSDRLY